MTQRIWWGNELKAPSSRRGFLVQQIESLRRERRERQVRRRRVVVVVAVAVVVGRRVRLSLHSLLLVLRLDVVWPCIHGNGRHQRFRAGVRTLESRTPAWCDGQRCYRPGRICLRRTRWKIECSNYGRPMSNAAGQDECSFHSTQR